MMLGLGLPFARRQTAVDPEAFIRDIFASGEQGAWYDPSDLNTLYQDSAAGTQPVTAFGQPVGLVLDKSGKGNHLSQATTAARPLTSARVNLLTKSEYFDQWAATNATAVPTSAGEFLLRPTATAGLHYIHCLGDTIGNSVFTIEAKANGYSLIAIGEAAQTGKSSTFNLSSGVSAFQGNLLKAVSLADGWWRLSYKVFDVDHPGLSNCIVFVTDPGAPTTNPASQNWTPDGVAGVLIRKAGQGRTGVASGTFSTSGFVADAYQRVNTATDYDTVGFPVALKFDGIDDGLSTGAITLGADMDCFIAVRRNSAAHGVTIHSPSSPGGGWAGAFEPGDYTPHYGISCGSPVTSVDGGSALANRDAVHLSLPPGTWHVLQIANLNLTTWPDFGLCGYGDGYFANANIGGVILCPAQTPENRAKIRQYLGAKVGLSL